MDDDLVLGVNRGDSVIALDHPMRSFHLGRFIVRDVALFRLAGFAGLVIMVLQPFPEFTGPLAQGVHILLFTGRTIFIRLSAVMLPVGGDDMGNGFLKLCRLFLEISPGAAPFLGSVAWNLTAVDGEHFHADQAQVIADQEHIPKQVDDLPVHGGDEVGNGGEMRPGIGGQGHEDNVLPAGLLDLPAGDDAPRVGVEHDLEQNLGIVGCGAGRIIFEAFIEDGEIELMVDQVVQGILESAGQDLFGEMDGDELALGV